MTTEDILSVGQRLHWKRNTRHLTFTKEGEGGPHLIQVRVHKRCMCNGASRDIRKELCKAGPQLFERQVAFPTFLSAHTPLHQTHMFDVSTQMHFQINMHVCT